MIGREWARRSCSIISRARTVTAEACWVQIWQALTQRQGERQREFCSSAVMKAHFDLLMVVEVPMRVLN